MFFKRMNFGRVRVLRKNGSERINADTTTEMFQAGAEHSLTYVIAVVMEIHR